MSQETFQSKIHLQDLGGFLAKPKLQLYLVKIYMNIISLQLIFLV